MDSKNYEEIKFKLESIIDIEKQDKWVIFTYKDHPYRGDFNIIDDYMYIKKDPYLTIEEIDGTVLNQVVLIRFNSEFIDYEFIEKIYDHHIDLVVKQIKNTLAEALLETFNYFSNHFEEKVVEKIWGDIGEAVFILKTHQYTNINTIDKLHATEDGLYDFSFSNQKYIEIKSTSFDKNEIVLTNCQIDYVNNRDFVIVKFKKIENATSIIDIYNLIKKNVGPIAGTILEENYHIYEGNEKIMSQFTVNLDKVEIWKLKDQCVPQVKIENDSALKKSKFYVDVSDGLESFEDYIKVQNLT